VIYFDTSYLVRLYYDDPGAEKVRALAASDNIACSAHGNAEMIAAFHRKLREGVISQSAYAALLGQVRAHDKAGAFQWLSAGSETYLRIAEVYAHLPATIFLRAADALHLATAAQAGFRHVYSNDVHLVAAAKHFGIEGRNPIGWPKPG
jgi:predicted nucleic acid-binding protein